MQHKSSEVMDAIVKAVNDFFIENGRTPSISEIAAEVKRSRSTVHGYLVEMSRQKILRYNSGEIETPLMEKVDYTTTLSPVVGSVICGEPQYEEENFEEYIALPTSVFGNGPFFLLHAKGYSMIEAGIDPGDLVVVKKQNTANEGDIVVALVNNETTLKRFYIDEEKKCVRLHPENKEMDDILVKDCYIQGVAQHVIKRIT